MEATAPIDAAGAIDLDRPETWPVALQAAVDALDHPPTAAEAASVARAAEHLLVRMYHATRLTDPEVLDLARHGLRPADPALIALKAARAATVLGADAPWARQVERRHLADEPGRRGVVWFCPWRAPVLDPAPEMLWIFFRHWGGQAIWLAHDGPARDRLRRIGRPVLVEAWVPAGALALQPPPGQPERSAWDDRPAAGRLGQALWDARHHPDPPPFIATVAGPVPPAQLASIRLGDDALLRAEVDPFTWRELGPTDQGRRPALAGRS